MTEIELKYPVEREGLSPLARVTVRRPRVKDIAAMEAARDRGEIAAIAAAVASMNGVPADVIEDMDAADFARLSEVLVPFLTEAAGGEASSPKSPTS